MFDHCILIPAFKKNVAFADDLVKKLAGVSLIQRAINKALGLTPPDRVYVVTDSYEIGLICQRNAILYYEDPRLSMAFFFSDPGLVSFHRMLARRHRSVILLSPYAPLLRAEEIYKASHFFQDGSWSRSDGA